MSSTGQQNGYNTFSCHAGSRDYFLHVPKGKVSGVLLMLHGCTQTPEDFATGTNIVNTAGTKGFIVILPAQSRGDNAQSCWNWFSGTDQKRDLGEPAILAGLTSEIAAQHGVDDRQIYVAGMSAGGAMAVILGETYSDVFSGIGVHSGLPYGCARGMNEAFAAMSGTSSRTKKSTRKRIVPTIVFHGKADQTVKPSNGAQIIADTLDTDSAPQTQIVAQATAGGRTYTRSSTLADDGKPLAEHWEIDGLGHAWSGGNPLGSHTDAKGPDASAEILRFFQSLSENEA